MDFELLKKLQQSKQSKLPTFLNEQYVSYELEVNNRLFEVLIPDSKSRLFEKWIDDCGDSLTRTNIKNYTHKLKGIFKTL